MNMALLCAALNLARGPVDRGAGYDPVVFEWYLYKHGVEHIPFVLAQARLESGNFNSELFVANNNAFGMKHPGRRATTSRGSAKGHAFYATVEDCAEDYALWQGYSAASIERHRGDYAAFLSGSGYCPTPGYVQKIKSMLKKNRGRAVGYSG